LYALSIFAPRKGQFALVIYCTKFFHLFNSLRQKFFVNSG
jgi:hypothetical protein